MMTDEKHEKDEPEITAEEKELWELDLKVVRQFVLHIEKAANEVLTAHNMADLTPELLISLLSCAAQISLELGMDEDDLAYVLFQTYSSVKSSLQEQAEAEVLKNWDMN